MYVVHLCWKNKGNLLQPSSAEINHSAVQDCWKDTTEVIQYRLGIHLCTTQAQIMDQFNAGLMECFTNISFLKCYHCEPYKLKFFELILEKTS